MTVNYDGSEFRVVDTTRARNHLGFPTARRGGYNRTMLNLQLLGAQLVAQVRSEDPAGVEAHGDTCGAAKPTLNLHVSRHSFGDICRSVLFSKYGKSIDLISCICFLGLSPFHRNCQRLHVCVRVCVSSCRYVQSQGYPRHPNMIEVCSNQCLAGRIYCRTLLYLL